MYAQFMIMANNYPNTNIPGASFGSQETNFEVSDFLEINEWIEENPPFSSFSEGYNPQNPAIMINEVVDTSSGISSSFHEGISNREGGSGKEKRETREKVAFRTKSNVEVLDDGFKWRKYGKKMVKNSPNPRNYYRCSVEGCPVKKRVERDKEDPRYVVTTYEGIHNHQGPQP